MKRESILCIAVSCILFSAASCERDSFYPRVEDSDRSELEYDDEEERQENNKGGNEQSYSGSVEELMVFDISSDSSPLVENIVIPDNTQDENYEDYVENYKVTHTLWCQDLKFQEGRISVD